MRIDWHDQNALERIRQNLVDRMEIVADFVKGAAKDLCPVDLGNLRASINHTVDVEDNRMRIVGRIGTNVEYAPYVEFGTGEYAENGQGRRGGWFFFSTREIPGLSIFKVVNGGYIYFTWGSYPQPFLRPALLQNKNQIKKFLNGV